MMINQWRRVTCADKSKWRKVTGNTLVKEIFKTNSQMLHKFFQLEDIIFFLNAVKCEVPSLNITGL